METNQRSGLFKKNQKIKNRNSDRYFDFAIFDFSEEVISEVKTAPKTHENANLTKTKGAVRIMFVKYFKILLFCTR